MFHIPRQGNVLILLLIADAFCDTRDIEAGMARKRTIVVLGIVLIAFSACGESVSKTEGEILAVMNAQVAAWNRGDIEGFMAGYWNSPDLLFASRGSFSRGWQPVLERYKQGYPEGEMGTLRFDNIEVHTVANGVVWVVGAWSLEKDDSSPHGVFTLFFEKKDEGWRIVHDHSSGVPETEN